MLPRRLLSLVLIATTVMLPAQAVFASSKPAPMPVAFTGNQKIVKFAIRNTTSTPLELRLGDQTVTIEPGKTMDLKLPVGTRITTASATPNMPSGTFILEVSTANSNAVISVS